MCIMLYSVHASQPTSHIQIHVQKRKLHQKCIRFLLAHGKQKSKTETPPSFLWQIEKKVDLRTHLHFDSELKLAIRNSLLACMTRNLREFYFVFFSFFLPKSHNRTSCCPHVHIDCPVKLTVLSPIYEIYRYTN